MHSAGYELSRLQAVSSDFVRLLQVVKFKSASGRSVFNAVFSRQKSGAGESFLPGRTAFVYDLESGYTPDIPMTLRRSKADCPQVSVM